MLMLFRYNYRIVLFVGFKSELWTSLIFNYYVSIVMTRKLVKMIAG